MFSEHIISNMHNFKRAVSPEHLQHNVKAILVCNILCSYKQGSIKYCLSKINLYYIEKAKRYHGAQ